MKCPSCEHEIDDLAEHVVGHLLCGRCAAVLVFDEDLRLSVFPEEDVKLLHSEDRAAIEAVRNAIRRMP